MDELKLKALLGEVAVDYEALQPAVSSAVAAFEELLAAIPEEEVPRSLASAFLEDLRVPPNKSLLVFRRPESVTVIGSYSTQTMVKPALCVDVAIRMPKACFLEKDVLDHRYHAKRALYLAAIRERLASSSNDVSWACLNRDARKPVLLIRQAQGLSLRILPTISSSTFDVTKLGRSRGNVKTHEERQRELAPHYDETILEDMFVEERNALEKDQISGSLRDGIVLLKVWLEVKGLRGSFDMLSGFHVSMLILHLASAAAGSRITQKMTALQIFRVVMELIGNRAFLSKAIVMQLRPPEKQLLSKTVKDEVVLVDTFGHSNLAFRLSKVAVQELQSTASNTVSSIQASVDNGFDDSFIRKVDFCSRYDYHVRIQAGVQLLSLHFVNDSSWQLADCQIENLIRSCLGDRVTLVRGIRRGVSPEWNPEKHIAECLDPCLLIGIVVGKYDTAFRMVDIGPSADSKEEASKFRSLWGEKAELRRFKDGTIAESAVWECESWQRHLIIPNIVTYVLKKHMSILEKNVDIVSGQLDFVLLEKERDPIRWTSAILRTFDTFSKRLRSLQLPLRIATVQPLSAAFRHAAVFPPHPHPSADGPIVPYATGWCLEPLEVMIQLEGSGRWPNDPMALQKTKTAFCLRIAESMLKKYSVPFIAFEEAIDFLVNGFAFRVRILYERDATLLKLKEGARRPLVPLQEIQPSHDLLLRSVHSSMLSGLQGRFPVYGPIVRLAKRWIAAHLFSGVLVEEATELLVAHLFCETPSPPSSRISGLLRFLRLLASFDWKFSPLIVDVNGDLSLKSKEAIWTEFRTGSGPAMFVATAYDLQSATWTKSSPSQGELKRLVAYAKSSAALLEASIRGKENRWRSLFCTPLNCYDIVIRLHRANLAFPGRVLFPSEVSKRAVVTCPSPQNTLASEVESVEKRLLVGFNPVTEFVRELKERFGDRVDVWYDAIGGEAVGVTLKQKQGSVGAKRKREETLPMTEIGSIGLDLVHSIFA